MTRVLITFLGRIAGGRGGYRQTVYQFPDGSVSRPVAFLGWPLVERMKPDRLLVLGTSGSQWDHLFEGDIAFSDEQPDARVALLDQVEANAVRPEHLAPLAPLLEERLACEVKLVVIPYCREEAEQAQMLATLAEHVETGAQVELDVTHGLRHLPMLALLGAFYLRRIREVAVAHIWYGEFDPDSGKAQVHDLAGLLRIGDWLEALAIHDRCGDYGVFGPLLGNAGQWLEEAAFHERSTNPTLARQALNTWANSDEPIPTALPEAQLFADALHARLNWRRLPQRDEQEGALARRYLAEGDYLRAAIFGQEGLISREVLARGWRADDYDARERARVDLNRQETEFQQLGRLRNALAHGIRPRNDETRKFLSGPDALSGRLLELLDKMWGCDEPGGPA